MISTRPLSSYERHLRYKAKHPERCKKTQRASKLKAKFGISIPQFDALLLAQGAVCAICKTDTTVGNGWHVDHCHKTDKVRGVLCHHCNLLLGNARDDTGFLANAISYLQNPPANAVLH
jgi:hypothetical protein